MNDPAATTGAIGGTPASWFDSSLALANAHGGLTVAAVILLDLVILAGCVLAIVSRRSIDRQVVELKGQAKTMRALVQTLSRQEERRMIFTRSNNAAPGAPERRQNGQDPLP